MSLIIPLSLLRSESQAVALRDLSRSTLAGGPWIKRIWSLHSFYVSCRMFFFWLRLPMRGCVLVKIIHHNSRTAHLLTPFQPSSPIWRLLATEFNRLLCDRHQTLAAEIIRLTPLVGSQGKPMGRSIICSTLGKCCADFARRILILRWVNSISYAYFHRRRKVIDHRSFLRVLSHCYRLIQYIFCPYTDRERKTTE